MKDRFITSHNALSDKGYGEEFLRFSSKTFKFDLQRFGKGGGGKDAGKVALSVVGFAVGFCNPAMFGLQAAHGVSLAAGIMGASLFSSIWTAFGGNQQGQSDSNVSVMRFDREQESQSLGGVVPVVYGRRKITGNQTLHETDADANTLHKHVVLCEGGIEGVENVTAASYNIPDPSCKNDIQSRTIFYIQNRRFEDAWVQMDGKQLQLYWNGNLKKLDLKNQDDTNGTDASYWSWQMEVSSLISYINRLQDGWEAFPVANTSRSAGDILVGDLTFKGRAELRKDGGDDWDIRSYRDGMVLLSVPNTRHNESHWHHMRKRQAWYCTFDRYVVNSKPSPCYLRPVPAVASTIAGQTKMTYHDGDTPDDYEKVGGYPNMAWLDLTFSVCSELNGNPSVEALVKGRKVYDTRINQWVYSTNPAMCLRDLLLNKTYGGGLWLTEDNIDEDSFKEAADWCDAEVSYKMADGTVLTGKRYELNLVMDNQQSMWDWIQNIMASFCGYLVLSKNKLHLRIERQTDISYKFTDSSIKDFSVSQISLDECPNQYQIKFIDPLNNWQTATAIVDDYGDQRQRHKIITKEVELEGVTSQAQALRLGRFYRDYNRTCTLQVEFKTGYQAAHLEPSDVVSITYKDIFVEMPFRITEIQETEDGEYTIKGRQYNPTIYNDTLGATITMPNYSLKKPVLGTPLPADGIRVTVLDDILDMPITKLKAKVTWGASPTQIGVYYSLYRKYPDGKWELLTDTNICSYEIEERQGANVAFRVIVRNESGLYSKAIETGTVTLHLTDNPPAAPQNVILTKDGAKFSLVWDKNTEGDFKEYTVKYRDKLEHTTDTRYTGIGVDGVNTVVITAYDQAGNSASTTKTFTMSLMPNSVAFVRQSMSGEYVTLSWDEAIGAKFYEISGDYHAVTYETKITFKAIKKSLSLSIRSGNDYCLAPPYNFTVDTDASEEKGTEIRNINLLDSVTLDNNSEFLVEDGVKTLVKKEIDK